MYFLPQSDPALKAKQQNIVENIELKNNMIVYNLLYLHKVINIKPEPKFESIGSHILVTLLSQSFRKVVTIF